MPDLAIFWLLGWSKIAGIPEMKVWREIYWQEPWHTRVAMGNSIPLYVFLFALGWILIRNVPKREAFGGFLTIFALGALLHLAGDLPVHVQDAHAHFWPISDWRFVSPVSYWNPAHYGDVFQIFEAILALGLIVILAARFKDLWARILLGLAAALYVGVPAYFYLTLG